MSGAHRYRSKEAKKKRNKRRPNCNKRKRLLSQLMILHKGHCTKCFIQVEREGQLQHMGFTPSRCGHYMVMGNNKFAIATMQHIIPRCKGGEHVIENLTLWCRACNNEDSRNHF